MQQLESGNEAMRQGGNEAMRQGGNYFRLVPKVEDLVEEFKMGADRVVLPKALRALNPIMFDRDGRDVPYKKENDDGEQTIEYPGLDGEVYKYPVKQEPDFADGEEVVQCKKNKGKMLPIGVKRRNKEKRRRANEEKRNIRDGIK